MYKKNLAIVGGGGAGSTAAWMLKDKHNISLFESETKLGGHACTEYLEVEGRTVAVDLGVEFFSEKQAPNLSAMLEHFQIPTFVAPLAFTAVYDDNEDYWNNFDSNNSKLWQEISQECNRFHLDMHEVMHAHTNEIKKLTLGNFLKKKKYSDTFVNKALMPLLTTFSSCKAPVLEYSLTYCAISFNMGLLSFFQPSYWRKAEGGIGSYVQKIHQSLGKNVHLNAKVKKVFRKKEGVVLSFEDGQTQEFDEVIFATHADIALSLIHSPTTQEENLLKSFEYLDVTCVLHKDESVLANNIPKRSYCEYNAIDQQIDKQTNGSLTRVINCLDPYRSIKTPILVTFNPRVPIAEEKIYVIKRWKLPKLRPSDMINKRNLKRIQGKNRFWFCGTDTSFTGHEGAILSGLVIAQALGANYPFARNDWARIQFEVVKGIMGSYNFVEKINNVFSGSVYKIAKTLGMHKNQVSRVLLDMYA